MNARMKVMKKLTALPPRPELKSLKIPLAGDTKNEGVFSFDQGLKPFMLDPAFLSCTKSENQTIPLVRVDVTIYANNPSFNAISVPGTWMYVNGGSRGIIIYRVSNEEFKAYDRHCTYDVESNCGLVEVDATNITGVDDCCGATFILTDGSVTKGPATFPLKQYQTTFDGAVLRIFN